jgi:hypothetical protein
MSKTFMILGALACSVALAFIVTNTRRVVRAERVNTRGAVLLHDGSNRVVVQLPKGHYLCSVAESPEACWSAEVPGVSGPSTRIVMGIVLDDDLRLSTTNSPIIRFQIKDDRFRPVILDTHVDNIPAEGLYLGIRGTF